MVPSIDEDVLLRLYLARRLLDEGMVAAQDPMSFGRMRCLLALDDAIELTLVTLLPILGKRPARGTPMAELLNLLQQTHPEFGAHAKGIEVLRDRRNAVKHDGSIPSPEDVRRAAANAGSFLHGLVESVIGRPLEEVTPAALIENPEVRTRLESAAQHLAHDGLADATQEAAVAFHLGIHFFNAHLSPWCRVRTSDEAGTRLARVIGKAARDSSGSFRGRMDAASSAVTTFAQEFARTLESSSRDLARALEELEHSIELLRYGIDLSDLDRFLSMTPHVSITMTGKPQVIWGRPTDVTRDEVVFAVDFVTRTLLRIQEWTRRNPRRIGAKRGAPAEEATLPEPPQ